MISLQIKRGISTDWSSENPVLKLGELGYVTDMNVLKIGDGVTDFVTLNPYSGVSGSTQFKPGVYIGGTGSGADYECDGTADDVQFQAAFDSALSGSTIYILPGTYNIAAKVTMSSSAGKVLHVVGIGKVILNINTAQGDNIDSNNGLYFYGSQIVSTTAEASATKGSLTVQLTNISSTQAGDLIKIYKNVLWCPNDYPTQQTGELYEVRSVAGAVVTLNEPLMRDYDLADTVSIVVYRPVEIHIENINLVCTAPSGNTGYWQGISIKWGKNCTVRDCYVKDFGMAGISFYTCLNSVAYKNVVIGCLKSGSGYGVAVWTSAITNIHHNYIENCRHCITGNSAETYSLSRSIFAHFNTLIGGTIADSHVVDMHNDVIDCDIKYNRIVINNSACYGFQDGSYESHFEGNEVYGGYGGITHRGQMNSGYHYYNNNVVDGGRYLYRAYSTTANSTKNYVEVKNNVHRNGMYGVYFGATTTSWYDKIVIEGNTFANITGNAIDITMLANDAKVLVCNNFIENCTNHGININGNTFTAGLIDIFNNKIVNPNAGGGTYSGINLLDVEHATILNNKVYDNNTNGGNGITTGVGCDYNVLIGNVIKGMSGAKFSLTGSNNFPATANVETLNHSF